MLQHGHVAVVANNSHYYTASMTQYNAAAECNNIGHRDDIR